MHVQVLGPISRPERKTIACDTCQHCGKSRSPNSKQGSGLCKYCSTQKAARVKSELYAIRRIAKGIGLIRLGTAIRAKAKRTYPRRRKPDLKAVCAHCGVSFTHKRGRIRRFCSLKCNGYSYLYGAPRVMRCVVCDTEFKSGQTRRKTCSDVCADRLFREQRNAHKARRRIKLKMADGFVDFLTDPRAVYVTALQVFKRDGWRCRACGCDTPMYLRGTRQDNAPELDHIVPVSAGGSHTMDNLQCLCRVCNQLKSNMDMNDFMRWATSNDVRHTWDQ